MISVPSGQMIVGESSSASASASASSATPGWLYDVFISFTGVDVRNNFVSHLYDGLNSSGIATFKDDIKLEQGKEIGPELVKAIKESRFAVVVFSAHYADSPWCLDELAQIIECEEQQGMKVFPVFFHIDSSEVQEQTGDYEVAFAKHEAKFPAEKVQKWRKALTKAASASELDVVKTTNGNESDCVRLIVRRILSKKGPYVANNIFGMELHLKKLEAMLNASGRDPDDVLVLGIWGSGGIGKTTIAQAIYGRISYKFEGRCFVENVKEDGSTSSGLRSLQESVLSKITGTTFKIGSRLEGVQEMSKRLSNKRVILVLDDVDNVEQIEALARTHWFGKRSIIIITTRDENVLPFVAHVYEPHLLNESDAIQVFSVHAFQQNSPPEGYKELSKELVCHADGLPLALKVLGSLMKGKQDVEEWRSVIETLATEPQGKIHKVLKLSYDGLTDSQKQIFLDIACFFKGQNKEFVCRIQESLGYEPLIAIRVLIRKSLLTVWNERLQMHDLIQEMGWHVVRHSFAENRKEAKDYSRLWNHNDICDVLTDSTENNVIQGIMLDSDKEVNIHSEALKVMKKLKFFDVQKGRVSVKPTHLPETLRWLNWNEYPFKSLPKGFRDLSGLQILKSENIQRLWDREMKLEKLTFIRLTGSGLKSFPDISAAPNLVTLILQHCTSLKDIHPTVGKLKTLVFLNLRNCTNLKSLPPLIGMESLETLILSGCSKLKTFPKISGDMGKLSKIYMDKTNIKVLDPLIGLKYLKTLDLSECYSLEELPNNFGSMECLEELQLALCAIKKFPESFSHLGNLKTFSFYASFGQSEASKHFLLNSLLGFSSLRKLELWFFDDMEKFFPDDPRAWYSLEELYISHSNLVQLPATIRQLPRLKILEFLKCVDLEELQELPCTLQILVADDCKSLRKIENLSTRYKLLYKMSFGFCHSLGQFSNHYVSHELLPFLLQGPARKHQFSVCIPGQDIPHWFTWKDFFVGRDSEVLVNPNWHGKIIGFAICNVTNNPTGVDDILFEIRDHTTMSEIEEVSSSFYEPLPEDSQYFNVFISYISFGFLQRIFFEKKPQYWSQVEGSLHIKLPASRKSIVRVLYEEDVNPPLLGFEAEDNFKFDFGNLELISKDCYFGDDMREEPFQTSATSAYVREEEFAGGQKRVQLNLGHSTREGLSDWVVFSTLVLRWGRVGRRYLHPLLNVVSMFLFRLMRIAVSLLQVYHPYAQDLVEYAQLVSPTRFVVVFSNELIFNFVFGWFYHPLEMILALFFYVLNFLAFFVSYSLSGALLFLGIRLFFLLLSYILSWFSVHLTGDFQTSISCFFFFWTVVKNLVTFCASSSKHKFFAFLSYFLLAFLFYCRGVCSIATIISSFLFCNVSMLLSFVFSSDPLHMILALFSYVLRFLAFFIFYSFVVALYFLGLRIFFFLLSYILSWFSVRLTGDLQTSFSCFFFFWTSLETFAAAFVLSAKHKFFAFLSNLLLGFLFYYIGICGIVTLIISSLLSILF